MSNNKQKVQRQTGHADAVAAVEEREAWPLTEHGKLPKNVTTLYDVIVKRCRDKEREGVNIYRSLLLL